MAIKIRSRSDLHFKNIHNNVVDIGLSLSIISSITLKEVLMLMNWSFLCKFDINNQGCACIYLLKKVA